MHALTEAAIRRSMVNCSRSEAASLTPPRDLDELDWASLDVLGWRDAKAELRGYLVHEQDGDPIGIALRAADTKMSSRRSAMCLLCHSVQSAAEVSLFTARRVGEAGRNGNTVGTYICADLDCASRVTAVPPSAQHLDEELQALAIEEQAIGLRKRLQAFTADVTRR
ncbi:MULTISPECIES: FBP domain-containing protein [unclassified Modestobacter]|uniref:FBP domain-containing protein n=1 Tax=unclassified Modestobacter TaxID=2643866 RepID=UPI0022AA111E|nr:MULTISPECIES: FBP domain-containing protein [unclassified Modestobacter]MCZ2823300.1 FBP domain-containing protein [Modestobacter sp. VKM Ac-2981]MCZ2851545.1 FBP domain-containing protein [Modestobacter sp. VKM Ac-2982]